MDLETLCEQVYFNILLEGRVKDEVFRILLKRGFSEEGSAWIYTIVEDLVRPYNTQKHMPMLAVYIADTYAGSGYSVDDVQRIYKKFVTNPKISNKDIFGFKSLSDLKQLVDHTVAKVQPAETIDLNTTKPDFSDENVDVYIGDSKEKCVAYGEGSKYGLCISRKDGSNLYHRYRGSKKATFYFIKFKDPTINPPANMIILHVYPDGSLKVNHVNKNKDLTTNVNKLIEEFPVLDNIIYKLISVEHSSEEAKMYSLHDVFSITELDNINDMLIWLEVFDHDNIIIPGVIIPPSDWVKLPKKLHPILLHKMIEIGYPPATRHIDQYPKLYARYNQLLKQFPERRYFAALNAVRSAHVEHLDYILSLDNGNGLKPSDAEDLIRELYIYGLNAGFSETYPYRGDNLEDDVLRIFSSLMNHIKSSGSTIYNVFYNVFSLKDDIVFSSGNVDIEKEKLIDVIKPFFDADDVKTFIHQVLSMYTLRSERVYDFLADILSTPRYGNSPIQLDTLTLIKLLKQTLVDFNHQELAHAINNLEIFDAADALATLDRMQTEIDPNSKKHRLAIEKVRKFIIKNNPDSQQRDKTLGDDYYIIADHVEDGRGEMVVNNMNEQNINAAVYHLVNHGIANGVHPDDTFTKYDLFNDSTMDAINFFIVGAYALADRNRLFIKLFIEPYVEYLGVFLDTIENIINHCEKSHDEHYGFRMVYENMIDLQEDILQSVDEDKELSERLDKYYYNKEIHNEFLNDVKDKIEAYNKVKSEILHRFYNPSTDTKTAYNTTKLV